MKFFFELALTPIVGYLVEYKKVSSLEWSQVNLKEPTNTLIVQGLEIRTKYHFRLSARNQIGSSVPSTLFEVYETLGKVYFCFTCFIFFLFSFFFSCFFFFFFFFHFLFCFCFCFCFWVVFFFFFFLVYLVCLFVCLLPRF